MMVAIPELDGATAPMVFGGRSSNALTGATRDIQPHERNGSRALPTASSGSCGCAPAIARSARWRSFSSTSRPTRARPAPRPSSAFRVPASNAEGDARGRLHRRGSGDRRRAAASGSSSGNAARFGADANVVARIESTITSGARRISRRSRRNGARRPAGTRRDGASLFVLGERFGNVLVGIQPAFGYEGDPMRLLFERGFAPTHAFSAFYRYLREDFGADVVLHFGTHGALEFMPGKQAGLSGACWPDRLIGDLPNLYLYASNNPSEGTIAKRRSAATLDQLSDAASPMPVFIAGLVDLKASLDRYRDQCRPRPIMSAACLANSIQSQAAAIDLAQPEPPWGKRARDEIDKLGAAILELEYTLIPHGLHVSARRPAPRSAPRRCRRSPRARSVFAMPAPRCARSSRPSLRDAAVAALPAPQMPEARKAIDELARIDQLLGEDHEISGAPTCARRPFHRSRRRRRSAANAGDPADRPQSARLRSLSHSERLRDRRRAPDSPIASSPATSPTAIRFRRSVAIVLWGTDNLKTEGVPIGQALALLGAEAAFRQLWPPDRREPCSLCNKLGRPRIDVMLTVSGIFRDLLPLQVRLLADACFLAASADEPEEQQLSCASTRWPIRPSVGCDLETAALARVRQRGRRLRRECQHLVDAGAVERRGRDLADLLAAQDASPTAARATALRDSTSWRAFSRPSISPIRISTSSNSASPPSIIISTRSAASAGPRARARGGRVAPIYIGDQTRGAGKVRTLSEQVALETRTRVLNPKWYEGMLKHGYEGVRQIEAHVTNTIGWSATTGEVDSVGLRAAHPRPSCSTPRCASGWRRSIPPPRPRSTNRLIEAHERRLLVAGRGDARRRCARLATSWKTALRAWPEDCRMNIPIRNRQGPRGRQCSGPARSQPQDRHRQGVCGLRQGRHRQEHDLVQSLGRLRQARQAGAADRLRSQSTIRPSR